MEVFNILMNCLESLEYLLDYFQFHHLALNPTNLLLSIHNEWKISNFGCAVKSNDTNGLAKIQYQTQSIFDSP